MSDSEILVCIRQGGRKENKAIRQMLEVNRGKVKGYVLKNSGNSSDAETVLVEGVTAAVLNIRKGKFRGDSALSTYIFAICKSTWLKMAKKNKRFADPKDEDVIDEKGSPLDQFNDQEIKETVNSLLSRLGDACQKVLRMWSLHYSMAEIATELGYKNSQIAMNKKNKCLTKLKDMVRKSSGKSDLLSLYLN